MHRYRCYYVRHSPYLGVSSPVRVAMYERTGTLPPMVEAWPGALTIPDGPPHLFTIAQLAETHVLIGEIDAASLDQVYTRMQGEHRPRTEIQAFNEHLFHLGVTHTSMSPGDVIEDVATGTYYECEIIGWRLLADA